MALDMTRNKWPSTFLSVEGQQAIISSKMIFRTCMDFRYNCTVINPTNVTSKDEVTLLNTEVHYAYHFPYP